MIRILSIDSVKDLEIYRADSKLKLDWPSPFVLPSWIQVWWESFGSGYELYIRAIFDNSEAIGIAPLMKKVATAYFIGNTDVCDYQDFVIAPGRESDFFNMLLLDAKKQGITTFDLKHVRPDSSAILSLKTLAVSRGYDISLEREDVSFEMLLPSTFDAYLESLNSKQRHEIRRKLRRLNEEGNIEFRFITSESELSGALETFFRMFADSREDKAAFLTEQMKRYFRNIVDEMYREGILRLGILELDKKPIAEILCFEYNNCLYLYNSGYDPGYISLSAGVLSKVMAIKYSIEKGIKKFDFLKGAEPYKAHIGGKEIPLFHLKIGIK